MGHLRTLKNTLCERISVRHGGAKFSQRENVKVQGGNIAYSPRELERSQRLIVFELQGDEKPQNMVDSIGPMGGEVSKLECVCSPPTLPLREYFWEPPTGVSEGFGRITGIHRNT